MLIVSSQNVKCEITSSCSQNMPPNDVTEQGNPLKYAGNEKKCLLKSLIEEMCITLDLN